MYGLYVFHNSLYAGLYTGLYSLYGMYVQKTKPRLLNTYGFKFRTAPKIMKMREFRHCRPSDLNSWKQAPGLTPGLKSRRVARTIVCDFSIGGGRSRATSINFVILARGLTGVAFHAALPLNAKKQFLVNPKFLGQGNVSPSLSDARAA